MSRYNHKRKLKKYKNNYENLKIVPETHSNILANVELSQLSMVVEICNNDSTEQSSFADDVWIEISECESLSSIDSNYDVSHELNFDDDMFDDADDIDQNQNGATAGFREFVRISRMNNCPDQIIFGLNEFGEKLNLDVRLSHVQSDSKPLVTYDIDSMFFKFDEKAINRFINLYLICSAKPLVSKNFNLFIG